MKYIDLTHTFIDNMPVYPGDPRFELAQVAYPERQGYVGYQVKMGLHVGTHLDAPFHVIDGRERISDLAFEKFFGRGYLLDVRGKSIIDVQLLEKSGIKSGDIVLIFTGFSEKFYEPDYYTGYPALTENFARRLIELNVKMVGLDTPGPDYPPFNVHKLLLSHDILIIENLTNLSALVGIKNFNVIALPMKIDAEAAPTRVIAQILLSPAGPRAGS